jgi:hypothetical protein
MATVRLTKRQTIHVREIVVEFLRCAAEGNLPNVLVLKLQLLRDMIDDGSGFADDDFAFLAVILEMYLAVFDEDDIDPLAEQAYAKCAGEWFILPPWYDRIKGREHIVGISPKQEPPLGT